MFDVDAVFLWVDGADMSGEGPQHTDASAPYRFTDHGELRYAIRSLEMYAPWIRIIHIVTNGQVPKWLNTDHPRIALVTHKDIFPDTALLPTFNSHAIELFLDRIPNLAEHFLAMNDDFFLGKPLQITDCFSQKDTAQMFTSSMWVPHKISHDSATWEHAVYNANCLLDTKFGAACRKRPAHQMRPMCKSVFRECSAIFGNNVAHAAKNRIRDVTDISFAWIVVPWYALLTQRATPLRVRESCITVYDDFRKTKQQFDILRQYNPTLFCINDYTVTNAAESWAECMRYLQERFSDPCFAER